MNTSSLSSRKYNVNIINKIIILLLFILYPFIALPFIFNEILRGRRYAYSLFAIFIGLLGFLYPPIGDLYRYHIDFEMYRSLDYQGLLDILTTKMDILQPMMFWSLSRLGFPPDIIRFIYVYISAALIFRIFYELLNTGAFSKRQIALIIILAVLFIRFERMTVRFGLSSSLFIYGWYSCLYKGGKYGIWAMILSVLNHFSFIVPVIAFISSLICKIRFHKLLILVLVFLTFCLSGDYLSALIQILPFDDNVVNHLLLYTDGYWAGDFLNDQSAKFKLGNTLLRIPFFVLSIIFYKWFRHDKFSTSILFTLMVVVISSPFESLRIRMEQIYVLQLIVFCVIYAKKWLTNILFIRNAICIGCIYLFICTWTIRRQLYISHEAMIFLPSVVIYNSGYDNNWVSLNVYSDGAPKNINF